MYITSECPIGLGRFKGYEDCEPCSPGTFNDGVQEKQKGSPRCRECPEGLTTSEPGATDESACTGIRVFPKLPVTQSWQIWQLRKNPIVSHEFFFHAAPAISLYRFDTVNSKFHLTKISYHTLSYHSMLKCSVNSNSTYFEGKFCRWIRSN